MTYSSALTTCLSAHDMVGFRRKARNGVDDQICNACDEAETIDKSASTATSDSEDEPVKLRQLYRQLAELRAKGIISGG